MAPPGRGRIDARLEGTVLAMLLGEQSWPAVDGTKLLLVPLGSTEQHGPHLPLDTDTRIAEAVARAAAAQLDSVVAPALAYGASGEHAGFSGTLSMGTDALRVVLTELVRSAAQTFEQIVFVNGHGGNHEAVVMTVEQMQSEGHRVTSWSPRIAGGDAHAGRTETSLLLSIAPEVVRMEVAEPGNVTPLHFLMDDLRAGGVAATSPNGVLGDPTGASADEGAALLAELVADLVASLT